MAIIKPFKGLRPPQQIVEDLACLPYDVMNSEEAARMAEGKKESLLRITKAEIECAGVWIVTVYDKETGKWLGETGATGLIGILYALEQPLNHSIWTGKE